MLTNFNTMVKYHDDGTVSYGRRWCHAIDEIFFDDENEREENDRN